MSGFLGDVLAKSAMVGLPQSSHPLIASAVQAFSGTLVGRGPKNVSLVTGGSVAKGFSVVGQWTVQLDDGRTPIRPLDTPQSRSPRDVQSQPRPAGHEIYGSEFYAEA